MPTPPRIIEELVRVRMTRQERLTQEPVLHLSAVLDEAVLLRKIGDRGVMRAQIKHLVIASQLPNVELRILPLNRDIPLVANSFSILSFGTRIAHDTAGPGDVVHTEGLKDELYVTGEAEVHLYGLFFKALTRTALSAAESQHALRTAMETTWS
jgi:hypothetical protein